MKDFSKEKTCSLHPSLPLLSLLFLLSFTVLGFSQTGGVLSDFDSPLSVGKNFDPALQPACGPFAIGTIGTTEEGEEGQKLIELPDGSMLMAVAQNDGIALVQLDESLNILAQGKFVTTPYETTITSLYLDSNDEVLVAGYTNTLSTGRLTFIFKYDYQNQEIIWSKRMDQSGANPVPIFFEVIEKGTEGAGNYLVIGQTSPNSSPGLGCDATVLELDRNDGSQLWAKNYNLGSCETFRSAIYHNDAIYAFGRYNNDGGGLARMRPGLTKLDLDGNQLWSKLYLANVNTTARLYGIDLIEDADDLVLIAQGDFDGVEAQNNTCYLFKVSEEGNMLWAREFDFFEGSDVRVTALVSTTNGYLMMGTFSQNNLDQTFTIYTTKNGILIQTTTYGPMSNTTGYDLVKRNEEIQLIGATDAFTPGDEEAFIAVLSEEGNLESACGFTSSVLVFQEPILDPYDEFHELIVYDSPYDVTDYGLESTEAPLSSAVQCANPCPSCVGSIAYLPEEATICEPLSFNFSGECEVSSLFWSFCDPLTSGDCEGIDIPSSTATNPLVQFSLPGDYVIQLTVNEGLETQLIIIDTITVQDADCCEGLVIECPADITIFCGDSTDPADLGTPIVVDSCGPVIMETEEFFDPFCGTAGTLFRTFFITDESASSLTCTQFITIQPDCAAFNVDLGPDQELCDGLIMLTASHSDPVCSETGEDLSYLWSNGESTESILVDAPGTYTVEVVYCNECIATDTIFISECTDVDCPTELFNGGTIAAGPCENGVVIIESIQDPEYEGLPLEAVWLQSSNGADCYNAVFELAPFNVGQLYDAFLAAGGFGLADPAIPGTSWQFVTDNDGDDFQLTVEALAETSCFMRCTRVVGCERLFGEGNLLTVEPCLAPFTNPNGGYGLRSNSNKDSAIKVFPNPAKAVVHFESSDFIGTEPDLLVYNNLGQLVMSTIVKTQEDRISIDLHHFDSGLYLAAIQINSQKTITKKFLINK